MIKTTNQLTVQKSKQEILSVLDVLFQEYDVQLNDINKISKFVENKDEAISYFLSGNKISHAYASQLFDPKGAIDALNATFWQKAIKITDVLDCMPATKRNEWNNMISEMKTPSFDKESVVATLYNFLLNRGSFLAEKVDGIFQKLSNTHVTNSPMGFKQRMIIDGLITSYGSISDRSEYINDLRGVIAKLMNRGGTTQIRISEILRDITNNNSYGEWFSFDGDAFKIRLYKKGTAHLEIHEDMAQELNIILSSKYPQFIGDSNKSKKNLKTKKIKEFELKKDLISFESCNYLSRIAESVARARSFSVDYFEIDNDQVLSEVMSVLEYFNVKKDGKSFSFDYDASSSLSLVSRLGYLPEQKSHQFYPTEEYLAKRLVNLASIESFDSILEPSAGLGGIANLLPRKRTTCIDVSPIHCEALKSMGFNSVECMDFLSYNKNTFAKIFMNPPFTKGQAEAHVSHALSLLKKGGELFAILPASLKGHIFDSKLKHTYSEVMTGQFSDANVAVVMVEIYS